MHGSVMGIYVDGDPPAIDDRVFSVFPACVIPCAKSWQTVALWDLEPLFETVVYLNMQYRW